MKKIWSCKIGEVDAEKLPEGSDGPMRDAVAKAYKELTGEDDLYIFSGWGAELTEPERAVIENRSPSKEYEEGWKEGYNQAMRSIRLSHRLDYGV